MPPRRRCLLSGSCGHESYMSCYAGMYTTRLPSCPFEYFVAIPPLRKIASQT